MSIEQRCKEVAMLQADKLINEVNDFELSENYDRLDDYEKAQLHDYCLELESLKDTYDGGINISWPRNPCKIFYELR